MPSFFMPDFTLYSHSLSLSPCEALNFGGSIATATFCEK